MDIITSFISDMMKQFQSWPNEVLLFGFIIAVAWAIQGIPQVSNRFIPLGALLLGAIGEVWIGNPGEVDPTSNPTVRLALIGALIGAAAWMMHAQVLKRIQAKLGLIEPEA